MKIFQSYHRENHREAPLNAKRNTKLQRGTISPVVSTSSLAERARGRQFVFVALNGVREENGYVLEGPHAFDNTAISSGREARGKEKGRTLSKEERRKDEAMVEGWDKGEATVDSFRAHCQPLEGSVFDRNSRKCRCLAPSSSSPSTVFAACRASHNCDLRGTGQLRSSDNGPSHSRRTIEQFRPRWRVCPSVKVT